MIFFGLDPGTQNNMALAALLPDDLRVQLVGCEGKGDARGRALAAHAMVSIAFNGLHLPLGHSGILAVEWQRPLPDDPRPQNISDLSAFAGIAMATFQSRFNWPLEVFTPLPEEWKGSIPKHVKHNRIVAVAGKDKVQFALEKANIPVPPKLGAFTKEFTGKAGNAIDAIGLAYWARDRAGLLERVRSARLLPPR